MIYISASTRPAWSQRMMGNLDHTTLPEVEKRINRIAERELQRTRVDHFHVIAFDDLRGMVRLDCDRTALFQLTFRGL